MKTYTFAYKGCPNVTVQGEPSPSIFEPQRSSEGKKIEKKAQAFVNYYKAQLGKGYTAGRAMAKEAQTMTNFRALKSRYDELLPLLKNPHHVLGLLASLALQEGDADHFLARCQDDMEVIRMITKDIVILPEEII